jgi:hypothetical protein
MHCGRQVHGKSMPDTGARTNGELRPLRLNPHRRPRKPVI